MSRLVAGASPGFTYRLLSTLLLTFWILHAIRHGAKHGLSNYLSMRLGQTDNPDAGKQIWIHASSVGEVQAITPLVEALLQRGETLLFTSFTASGYRTIRDNFSNRLQTGVIPIDFFWLCGAFFKHHKPKLGIIMETELWPELLYQAQRHDVPLLQVNARLSDKTTRANAYVRQLAAATLGRFNRIFARGETDRNALIRLGATEQRVEIVGNLKTTRIDDEARPRLVERDYVLLASSHTGEEQRFVASRPVEMGNELIVIAPRHPGRSDAIQKELTQLGVEFAVRSKAETVTESTRVYLADTLGEMKALMAHARVVVMGGSFDQTGGHNLLEPASLGCAIITGPSDSNIRNDIKMLGDGLIQVGDIPQCWRRTVELLENPEQAARLGEISRERLAQQPDMVEKYMEAIGDWL